MGGFIIHRSLSVSSVERSGYAFMLPLQRASNAFAFPACSFFTRISSPRGDPRPSKACLAPPPPHTAMWHCRRGRCAARFFTHALTPALRPSTRSASRLRAGVPVASHHTSLQLEPPQPSDPGLCGPSPGPSAPRAMPREGRGCTVAVEVYARGTESNATEKEEGRTFPGGTFYI